jgi:hypothetical protein
LADIIASTVVGDALHIFQAISSDGFGVCTYVPGAVCAVGAVFLFDTLDAVVGSKDACVTQHVSVAVYIITALAGSIAAADTGSTLGIFATKLVDDHGAFDNAVAQGGTRTDGFRSTGLVGGTGFIAYGQGWDALIDSERGAIMLFGTVGVIETYTGFVPE